MKCVTQEFGPNGITDLYRYKLGRDWSGEQQELIWSPRVFTSEEDGPRFRYALFIMLNPSTADHAQDDPTVAKCIRLARRWGFQGLQVRNIFAIRGTDPKVIKRVEEPTGGVRNDMAIREAAMDPHCGLIVAAWGNHGGYKGRSSRVRQLLQEIGRPVCCFKISNLGEPEHPLYQTECDLEVMERWL